MYAVVAVVKSRDGRREPGIDCASLTDAFWAHTQHHDRLEHVRISRSAQGLSVTLFLQGRTERDATTSGLALCRRVVRLIPALDAWHVESCNPWHGRS